MAGNILIFFDANGLIYSCCRITSSVVLLFTVATSTVLIVFYSMVIGNPDSLKVILSDIQLFAYQRHAHSLLISFVILNLSSILVGTLLILGKKPIRTTLLNQYFQIVENIETTVGNCRDKQLWSMILFQFRRSNESVQLRSSLVSITHQSMMS